GAGVALPGRRATVGKREGRDRARGGAAGPAVERRDGAEGRSRSGSRKGARRSTRRGRGPFSWPGRARTASRNPRREKTLPNVFSRGKTVPSRVAPTP